MRITENYIQNVAYKKELPAVNGLNYMEGLQKYYGETPVKQAVQNIFQAEDKGSMPAFKTRLLDAMANQKPTLNGADQKYLDGYVRQLSINQRMS